MNVPTQLELCLYDQTQIIVNAAWNNELYVISLIELYFKSLRRIIVVIINFI